MRIIDSILCFFGLVRVSEIKKTKNSLEQITKQKESEKGRDLVNFFNEARKNNFLIYYQKSPDENLNEAFLSMSLKVRELAVSKLKIKSENDIECFTSSILKNVTIRERQNN